MAKARKRHTLKLVSTAKQLKATSQRLSETFGSQQFLTVMKELEKISPKDKEKYLKRTMNPAMLRKLGVPVAKGATITARYFFEDKKVEGVVRTKAKAGNNLKPIGVLSGCVGVGGAGACACLGL